MLREVKRHVPHAPLGKPSLHPFALIKFAALLLALSNCLSGDEAATAPCIQQQNSPDIADATDPRFRTFSFTQSWADGPPRNVEVQVSRNIRGLNDNGAHDVADYVARQVQQSHNYYIRQRGLADSSFPHLLLRVFAPTDPEITSHDGARGFFIHPYIGLNMFALAYPNSTTPLPELDQPYDNVIHHELGHRLFATGPLNNVFTTLSSQYGPEAALREGMPHHLEKDIRKRYQAVLQFPVNPALVEQRSYEAQRCFDSSPNCTMPDQRERALCCVTRYDGLNLTTGTNIPAQFQGLALDLYAINNTLILRLLPDQDREGGIEVIFINNAGLDSPGTFRCSNRQHPGSNLIDGIRQHGIGDICHVMNSDDGQRQIVIFPQDIHPGEQLDCQREGYREDRTLEVRDLRGTELRFINRGAVVPYNHIDNAWSPYVRGACFFEALEQLNPDRFRALLPTLQGSAGFSACQRFDAIQWFADQMGVAPAIIEELMRRTNWYYDGLRQGLAIQWVRED